MAAMSGVRKILEDAAHGSKVEGIPFANLSTGNPAAIPEVRRVWQDLYREVLGSDRLEVSSRYGPTRGLDRFVEAIIASFNKRYGWEIGPENLLVGPGAQFLTFIATAAFTGPTDWGHARLLLPVVPDYAGYQSMPQEKDAIVGVVQQAVPAGKRRFEYMLDLDGVHAQTDVGMLLCSNPSNPTGKSLQQHELTVLADVAAEWDVPLVVDNAYGSPFPLVTPTCTEPRYSSHVINLFTLSKAGLPGERIGFAIGPADHIAVMTSFMANSALHAPMLGQAVAARALETGTLDELAERVIRPYYRARQQTAALLLDEHLPEDLAWTAHRCDGGLFSWIVVDDERFDASKTYETLKQLGVYVVPGTHFFPQRTVADPADIRPASCLRISLSADDGLLDFGVRALGEVLASGLP